MSEASDAGEGPSRYFVLIWFMVLSVHVCKHLNQFDQEQFLN